ncbi:PTS sugar transporter subunit IIA [Ornithinibacillus sp. 179-J 7C1 HS]|uniref:PTS sugar transporter subunit IIA n=1 Tax=Ornithinibacillus sp. 179-J 7C1 HS TaxID=3142384 RepID=UPI00399F84FF
MSFNKVISEELVFFLDVSSKDELFEIMFQKLYERGIVKTSYLKAITLREEEFPTGLATETLGVALPHTDPEHVNEEAICIGILKEPVPFRHMGMGNQEVNVQLVFMLALKKPENQLEVLQTVIGLIQNKDFLKALTNSDLKSEVIDSILKFTEGSVTNNK